MKKLKGLYSKLSARRIAFVFRIGFILCELVGSEVAIAEECAGTITADETLRAENYE